MIYGDFRKFPNIHTSGNTLHENVDLARILPSF